MSENLTNLDHCAAWSERITCLVVGELAPEEQSAVEEHLESCDGCQASLAKRRETVALLKQMPEGEMRLSGIRRNAVEEAVASQPIQEVHDADAEMRGSANSAQRWLAAATAAAVLLLGALIWVLAVDGRWTGILNSAGERNFASNDAEERLNKSKELAHNSAAEAPQSGEEAISRIPTLGDRERTMSTSAAIDRTPGNRTDSEIECNAPVGFESADEYRKRIMAKGAETPRIPDVGVSQGFGDLYADVSAAPDLAQYGNKADGDVSLREFNVDTRANGVIGVGRVAIGAAAAAPHVTELALAPAGNVGGRAGVYCPLDWILPAEWTPEDRVRHYVSEFTCRPQETPPAMFFRYWGDNPFIDSVADNQATFAADVDTASYTLARNYLARGVIPPKEAIRTEEFVNYFPSRLPPPAEGDFAIHTEMAPSLFAHRPDLYLLKVGVKAREVDAARRKPIALTFVIDVSGSMNTEHRLDLVKDSVRTLIGEMQPADTVGIVVFESTAREVLQPVSAERTDAIFAALTSLTPGSSTNVQHGLELGYAMAMRHMRLDATNRVALFSDGVANTGVTDAAGILRRVREYREEGVLLSTFGVGMGNHNDTLLEQLADKGDGQCAYIDSLAEATRIFRRNLVSTFETIARDAKVQVEFNRDVVAAFRQIGYENRAVADRDFRNDAIDAGEINAGHEVVALFEVMLRANVSAAQWREVSPATVRLRYARDAGAAAVELSAPASGPIASDFAQASARFRLSATVAAFADLLRGSFWARQMAREELLGQARSLLALDTANDQRVAEFVALIEQADRLVAQRLAVSYPQQARDLDDLRYNYYLRTRLSEAQTADAGERERRLAEENRRLEDALRALLCPPGSGRR